MDFMSLFCFLGALKVKALPSTEKEVGATSPEILEIL